MNADSDKNIFVITCRIDGKDSSGVGLYGLLVSVVDSQDLLFNGALFSREPIDGSMPVAEKISFIQSQHLEERPEEFKNLETSLDDYIRTSRLFQNDKNIHDPKTMEHKITYFFTTVMSFNAISFLEVAAISREGLGEIIPSLKKGGEENTNGENLFSDEDEDQSDEDILSTVPIRCDPILDPVHGVPIGSLEVGTMIYCKMREDSVFYSLMTNASADFDGVVKGDVAGVSVSEHGVATVVVKLSEGLTGAIKAASSVRMKLVDKSADADKTSHVFGVEIVFAVAGVIIFLCIMALLLYYLA